MFQGMLVRLCPDGTTRDSLKEFQVNSKTESARVGQMSIIFHIDVETLMMRFPTQNTARNFISMVSNIRRVLQPQIYPLVRQLLILLLLTLQIRREGVSVQGADRGGLGRTVFPVLRLPVSAAEHDARLCTHLHIPKSHPVQPNRLQGQSCVGRRGRIGNSQLLCSTSTTFFECFLLAKKQALK